jgi:branched-chain amino acid transport system ATP-binding protein
VSDVRLRVDGLEVWYGRVRALHGIALTVRAGEAVTIVGPNGAGKSTLLRALMGLVPARAGALLFDGEALHGQPTESIVRRGVALVPEGRDLFGPLTVRENLLLGAYAVPRAGRRDARTAGLERALALFPALRGRLGAPVHALSGGEQQMVALARALVAQPRLLLLDEPSVGLAPLVVREIFRTLGRLKAAGLTILLVEQNARAAVRLADRGYALAPGRPLVPVAGGAETPGFLHEAYGLGRTREEVPS